ncbi:MAG TPA: Ig-like domain-containing protein [Streptosporangiaceae bacterium]|nr:Ig-like domain-containing protein [Streptosporangiaceae bacterium]
MRDSEGAPTHRGKPLTTRWSRLGVTAVCGALAVLAAACSGSGTPAAGKHPPGHTTSGSTTATLISITPSNGSTHVRPDRGVTVTAKDGKLRSVVVNVGHDPAAGTLSQGDTVWHSLWPLDTGRHYTVTATAVGADGKTVTATSTFRTLTPAQTFTAQTFEGYHQSYGVGMPIMINFSVPVTHEAEVERAMQVTTSNPVTGAWYWDGNQVLVFRPMNYWPQHTKVSFVGHFNGVEAAPGVYGTANLSQSFTIGNSLIVVASTADHYMRVWYKNKLYARWPISTGRAGDDTSDGTYLTIEKHNPTLMSGPGYHNVPVNFAVRFTWSGDYIHSAPWSVAQQGTVNVSHGCVNVAPNNATTYYDMAVPGDPVTIIGSPVAGKWDDGWTEWFLTWKQLLRGSATHLAVQAGPSGSTFVNPSTLTSGPASGTLSNSRPRNFLAFAH